MNTTSTASTVRTTLQVDHILTQISVNNKTGLFQAVSEEMSHFMPSGAGNIFDHLMKKEQNQSSGIGGGVAIADAQMLQIKHPHTLLTVLKKPIEFNALDGKPVDIIMTLISPRTDGPLHLQRLSSISRQLKNKTLLTRMRESEDPDLLRSILKSPNGWMLAA